MKSRLREGAQGALRLHRREQGTRRRGGFGRSGRRRREIPREMHAEDRGAAALAREPHAILLRRRMAQGRCLSRAISSSPGTRSPAPPSSSSRTRPSSSKMAGRRELTAKNHLVLTRVVEAASAQRRRHQGRSGDAGDLQQPVHVDRRADGRDAAEHGLFREHQGAARFLLRGVFDDEGTLVANAPHMPVHLGSMDRSVETIIRENKGKIRPGDVYAINAPYNGGTHLPDITVCTPVFDGPQANDPVLGRLARPSRRCRRHLAGLDVAARDQDRAGRRLYRQFQDRRSRPLPREGTVRAAHRRAAIPRAIRCRTSTT